MVLSNASKKSRYSASISNNKQGGGNKKAGFPYQVGRSSATSIALNSTDPVSGHCCNLNSYQTLIFSWVKASRPVGSNPIAYHAAMH